MIHKETVDAFIKARRDAALNVAYALRSNNSDIFWYPEIPEDLEYKIRDNFGIGSEETILFIRDSSLLNKRDKGIVVTDCGVNWVSDGANENGRVYLPWESVERVIYDSKTYEKLDFYRNNGEKRFSIALGEFSKTAGQKDTINKGIGFASPVLGAGLKKLSKWALRDRTQCIGEIFAKIFTAMAETQEGVNLAEHFFELPYEKRKIILVTKGNPASCGNSFITFNIDRIPNMDFPIGHPVANQLYVGHPYICNKYIPFENYEFEFVEDKIREYCQLMQYLGATEINIESILSSDSTKDTATSKRIKGNVSYEEISASANWGNNATSKLLESISNSLQLHQIYHPSSVPKIPGNLVWYEHEPSWQRTCEQRMQGSLLEHEERIETRKSRVVNSSELKTLSAEFKTLIVSAGGEWEKSMEEQFETQENVILSIKVKFAPLESLQGEVEPIPTKIEASTKVEAPCKEEYIAVEEEYIAVEEEYMEEVKACMEESSEISASERRLLDKLRAKLGISEERVAELEASLQQPQLSEEEEEYMEEVKACLEESSEISSGERRLLNRVREKLGISEERAVEIENMCNHLK